MSTTETQAVEPLELAQAGWVAEVAGLCHEIRRLTERNAAIEAALKAHHRWHHQEGLKIAIEADGETITLDAGLEYADSSLCEQTLRVLSGTPEDATASRLVEENARLRRLLDMANESRGQ